MTNHETAALAQIEAEFRSSADSWKRGSLARAVPPERRSQTVGLVSAAGSLGTPILAPVGRALTYAAGLSIMAASRSAFGLDFGGGIVAGLGVAGTGFGVLVCRSRPGVRQSGRRACR